LEAEEKLTLNLIRVSNGLKSIARLKMRLNRAISRLTVASERRFLCFVGVFNRDCLNRSIENGVIP
jgi:hypothetical protein